MPGCDQVPSCWKPDQQGWAVSPRPWARGSHATKNFKLFEVIGHFKCPIISPVGHDCRLDFRTNSEFGALKPGLGRIVGWLAVENWKKLRRSITFLDLGQMRCRKSPKGGGGDIFEATGDIIFIFLAL